MQYVCTTLEAAVTGSTTCVCSVNTLLWTVEVLCWLSIFCSKKWHAHRQSKSGERRLRGCLYPFHICLIYENLETQPQMDLKIWNMPHSDYSPRMQSVGHSASAYGQRLISQECQPFAVLPALKSEAIASGVFTQFARIDLAPHLTDGIKKAAKSHSTSVSYVVGAALALAIFKNCKNQATAKAVILPAVPTDGRPWLLPEESRHFIANGLIAAGSIVFPVSLLKVGCHDSWETFKMLSTV